MVQVFELRETLEPRYDYHGLLSLWKHSGRRHSWQRQTRHRLWTGMVLSRLYDEDDSQLVDILNNMILIKAAERWSAQLLPEVGLREWLVQKKGS